MSAPAVTPVAILDDNDAYRALLASTLASSARYRVHEAFERAEDAIAALAARPAPIALVDIEMPGGMSGTAAVAKLRTVCPQMRCLMLTSHDDATRLFDSLDAGASGYLLKSDTPGEILAALDELMAGGAPMSRAAARQVVAWFNHRTPPAPRNNEVTARESEIMESLACGFSSKEIARKLGISSATVKNHLSRIYDKLGVRSRTEAVVQWLRR